MYLNRLENFYWINNQSYYITAALNNSYKYCPKIKNKHILFYHLDAQWCSQISSLIIIFFCLSQTIYFLGHIEKMIGTNSKVSLLCIRVVKKILPLLLYHLTLKYT